jgi:PPOX class probable F420-dependent enzyme
MSNQIPDSHKELFEKPVIASLATIMPSGQPQVNPVWCDYDGTHVRVNSSKGRAKDKNMRERPQVTLLLINPESVWHWIEVRGTVEEIIEEGADAHIDALAQKYLGVDKFPYRQPDQVRVMYKIKPTRVNAVDRRR